MPRQARTKSSTNIYHIMLRGINRQNIFFDNNDRRSFLKYVKEVKNDSPFLLFAYCLMDNHIHLLMQEDEMPLEIIMKRIGVKYAIHFNNKYSRSGHVFQDRFKSENVEDERYFLTVLRYILQNPVKAGICPEPGDYRWSSYMEFFQPDSWIDNEFAVSMVDRTELISFICMKNEDLCMDIDENIKLSKKEAERIIREKCSSIVFEDLSSSEQNELIGSLIHAGCSGPQIRDNLHITDYRVRVARQMGTVLLREEPSLSVENRPHPRRTVPLREEPSPSAP